MGRVKLGFDQAISEISLEVATGGETPSVGEHRTIVPDC